MCARTLPLGAFAWNGKVGAKRARRAYCGGCGNRGAQRRLTTVGGRARRLLLNAVFNSKRRGHPAPELEVWMLERAIERGVCAVSGVSLVLDGGSWHPLAPSLDRPDPSRPYTHDNFRIVAWAVNTACGSWGLDVYLAIAAHALGVSTDSDSATIARIQEKP